MAWGDTKVTTSGQVQWTGSCGPWITPTATLASRCDGSIVVDMQNPSTGVTAPVEV
ncbi:hypothetical protein [Dactylosporangium sp. CA-139066]|uniref:hypothetical protein n=1 Tax=Dactylosporangium sp. CA-139066 TaxID=3239930 RepID=UPI003D8EA194